MREGQLQRRLQIMRSGGVPPLAPTHAASSSGSSGSSSGHGGGGGLSFERFSAVFAAAPDLGTLETARELLGRAASSKRAFAALKQGHYQLRAAWGATGQLSGIWLGLWASASGGAAQSASMFIAAVDAKGWRDALALAVAVELQKVSPWEVP